jgi:1-acyl-sn-glycerol-3-phosphate acyltransferase
MKTVVIIFGTVLATLLFAPMAIVVSLWDGSGNLSHRVARLWGGWILGISGIRVKVRGMHHIEPRRSYIYMSNHQSNFDVPVLLAQLPVQFRWLAKAELFRIPVFGLAMRRVGYISIDRSDRRLAFASLRQAAQTIRSGVSVLIFPEGTRSRDGRMRSFKKGGFVMAIDAGVPIVPVTVHGTWDIMPKDRWRIVPGTVGIEIGAPIETRGYTRQAKQALMQRVHAAIQKPLEAGRRSAYRW